MNSARAYYAQNSGVINYVIYAIVAIIIGYYIYAWYTAPSTDLVLLNVKTPANQITQATISKGSLPAIRSGGMYTLSVWMYINSYEYRPGKPRSVFTITDSKYFTPGASASSPATGRYLAVGMLYPNEPKMMIRFATPNPPAVDYTNVTTYNNYMNSSYGVHSDSNPIELPSCDVMEVDLQRWINLTISVNGRIVDVYMDGKLTRSCVLSDLPLASQDAAQAIMLGGPLGFSGYFGNVQFSGTALSPDRIYSLYQAGPYPGTDSGFLGFLGTKLGLTLQYGGSSPTTTT
jgi:hypothetical protein